MPDSLITAVVEGLRHTVPFRGLPATSRPTEQLWTAHNDTLLLLRLPLYHDRLRKPRPKQKVYDAAIQAGLAVLGAVARETDTHQAIVRIADGEPDAISFQPRPFGANWTREHGITPTALQQSWSDPLLECDPVMGSVSLTMDVSTRDIVHLAAKVALAVVKSTTTSSHPSGTATFTFTRRSFLPEARVVYRPLQPNEPARIVELVTTAA